MSRLVSTADYRAVARKRLPRIIFDFLEGGALDEVTLRANTDDLAALPLRQRVLGGTFTADLGTTVLGHRLATPVAIAPMGLLSLFRPDADVAMAKAARTAGSVFVHSAWSGAPLLDVAAAAPGAVWAQVALWADRAVTEAHLARVRSAGIDVLVLPADVGLSSKRERDLRNGFTMAGRPRPGGILDAARRPRWSAGFLATFLTGRRVAFRDQSVDGHAMTLRQMDAFMHEGAQRASWDDVRDLRRRWSGRLVIKGIMTAQDARTAVDHGADGVYVSNHGGRQFDGQSSTVRALPEVVDAVDGRAAVLVDGGIRRGADLVRMRALGADLALIGRPAVYGLMHSGEAGVSDLISMLREEADVATAFTGNTQLSAVNREVLVERPYTDGAGQPAQAVHRGTVPEESP